MTHYMCILGKLLRNVVRKLISPGCFGFGVFNAYMQKRFISEDGIHKRKLGTLGIRFLEVPCSK